MVDMSTLKCQRFTTQVLARPPSELLHTEHLELNMPLTIHMHDTTSGRRPRHTYEGRGTFGWT